MIDPHILILPTSATPGDERWLGEQPGPVIAWGAEGEVGMGSDTDRVGTPWADVVVTDIAAAEKLAARIRNWPLTAMTLVQVLRSSLLLPTQQALDLESLAYATLQAGPEFARWLKERGQPAASETADDEPLLLTREGGRIDAVLNRAVDRNPISVEMRDALVAALELFELDDTVTALHLSGRGACFSIGGDLREFGSLPDPAMAHWVRTVHSPARLLARWGARISASVHGACIGSGLELPAFAAHVSAHRSTFFQLPELSLGLIPGAGGTVSIAKRIGRQRLAWLVLSGRRINARTALAWGLVDEVVH